MRGRKGQWGSQVLCLLPLVMPHAPLKPAYAYMATTYHFATMCIYNVVRLSSQHVYWLGPKNSDKLILMMIRTPAMLAANIRLQSAKTPLKLLD